MVDAAPGNRTTPDRAAAPTGSAPTERASTDDDLPSVPWHFKALVGALVLYLGFRFVEMGEWLLRRL